MKNWAIKWKTVYNYASMSNGRAERMTRTIKRALIEIVENDNINWLEAVMLVLYGYYRRNIGNQLSTFYLMYDIPPRFSRTG